MTIQELFLLVADREIPDLLPMPEGTHLNIGAGSKLIPNTIALDLPSWNANTDNLPYNNKTISGIHCYNFLEHIDDPIDMLKEFERVLIIGGVLNIGVPHYNSQGAFHDLTHKHFFSEDTWKTLFHNEYFDPSQGHKFKFKIGANFAIGIAERNLFLITQLIKEIR